MTKHTRATTAAMRTSASDDYPTPDGLFAAVSAEFGPFDLDPCATAANAKAMHYMTKEDHLSALFRAWEGRVWLNPPYGPTIGQWVAKAHLSAQAGALVVCLVPSRTDTAWWHEHAMHADEIRFIRGRLQFGGKEHRAPFPSALLIFRPSRNGGAGGLEAPSAKTGVPK